jgi:Ca2+-transporting ATPase
MSEITWHTLTFQETAERLKTDLARGLSSQEADARLAGYGPNVLPEKGGPSPFFMFLSQFKDFMVLVLIGAAVISGVVGDITDAIAIIVIVVINAAVGFYQESRAERAMQALKALSAPEAMVVREGATLRIPASGLVPGDVALLEAGDIVPADIRLVEAHNLMAGEAALTGESLPVEKFTAAIKVADTATGERVNMAYKGATIASGRGRGVVVSTGTGTELGKVALLIQQDKDDKTPLQKRLADFGKKLSIAVLAICAIVFAVGLMRGEPALLMFMTAVSLAVAAIPESLPAVVTISLALGASEMSKKNALVRRLSAVETLGSVTYICADKTGTLTQNRMKVTKVFADGEMSDMPPGDAPRLGELLMYMAISNDVTESAGALRGDPTEVALYEAAREAGYDKDELEKKYPRVAEIPFDSTRKLMSTVHKGPDGRYLMITKGAVEAVMAVSGEPGGRAEIEEAARTAYTEGYRVLAFGSRTLDSVPDKVSHEIEQGLKFTGFACLTDPPRPEAPKAVAECAAAGIKTVMITGDHPMTAARVAGEVGIYQEGSEVLAGPELSRMSMDEFEAAVEGIRVYARVAPEQKLRIVRALKDRGQFVAMTGDGVNDAPALKAADIGVAMGLTGTDVARESSDMVLMDDNFVTIVNAVREGRRIYDNIRKFIRYVLASNSGEIWTLFLAPLLGLPIPLLPVQILWINLVTDGLPGLALAMEGPEEGLMRRPPRPPSENIFAHGLGFHVIWVGLLIGAVSISAQAWAYPLGGEDWRSMVFTVLCLSQLGNALANRSETVSLFRLGITGNRLLLFSVILTFLLQMATLYVPFLNPVFRTRPLTPSELAVAIGLSLVVPIAVEIEKSFKRRMVIHT